MKPLCLLLLTASLAPAAVVFNQNFVVNTAVPDNDGGGLLFGQTLTGTGISAITSLRVNLQMTGGWNGDLYMYLAHESGFAVLLNRIGATDTDESGSGSSGFNITFDDAALNGDIHLGIFAMSQVVTGTWAPDGRTDSPFSVTGDATLRTALLSSFHGLPGDGHWELFVADVSAGSVSTIGSWGLTITGINVSAIPEPSGILALGGLLAAGLCLRNRRSRSSD